MKWVALSLLSAISVAASDLFAKSLTKNHSVWQIIGWRNFFAVPLCLMVLALTRPISLGLDAWIIILLLVPMEVIASFLYIYSISVTPLALSLPFLAFTPLFMIFTSQVVLGESLTAQGVLGIAFVVFGAYVLYMSPQFKIFDPVLALAKNRGSLAMLGSAAIYSVTSVLAKKGALLVGDIFFGALYFTILGIVMPLIAFAIGKVGVKDFFKPKLAALLSGIALGLMVIFFFAAIAKGEAAYVIAVKRTNVLFGVVFGTLIFGESFYSYRLFGTILMVLGAVLISLA